MDNYIYTEERSEGDINCSSINSTTISTSKKKLSSADLHISQEHPKSQLKCPVLTYFVVLPNSASLYLTII